MTTTLSPSGTQYAAQIAKAIRVCNHADIMDFNGHVSVREPGTNIMWINNRHASRSTLTEEDIVPFDIVAGKRIGEGIEPPSEWYIHSEIYKRRPDVGGIVHSHPEHLLVLTGAGITLRPITSVGTFMPEAGAPLFDTPVLINTQPRGEALAKALGESPIVVLRQHGTVTVGKSPEEAVVRMLCAENNARIQMKVLDCGEPRYITGEELKTLARENWGDHATKKLFHYSEETARRAGALDGLK
jgi:ribulose-5-phosphate 4-epimerase/fuculose-1-phosphate aldolase